MTSSSSSTKKGLCRRSLLKCVPVIAGAVISTTGMAESLFAQTKLTHEAVKYQDNPKDGQSIFRIAPQFVGLRVSFVCANRDFPPYCRRETAPAITGTHFRSERRQSPFLIELDELVVREHSLHYPENKAKSRDIEPITSLKGSWFAFRGWPKADTGSPALPWRREDKTVEVSQEREH